MNTTDEASEAGVKGLVQIRVEKDGAQAPKAITEGLSSQQIEGVMTACNAQEVRCNSAPAPVTMSALKSAAVAAAETRRQAFTWVFDTGQHSIDHGFYAHLQQIQYLLLSSLMPVRSRASTCVAACIAHLLLVGVVHQHILLPV